MKINDPCLEPVHWARRLPEPLRPLADVAHDFWWTWNEDAESLFERLSPELWRSTRRNAVRMLQTMSESELKAAADNTAITEEIARIRESRDTYLNQPTWWDQTRKPGDPNALVAYFCAEFGLLESFQIYSGGLGLLAGDHLKSSSDLGVPLVGVGLLYAHGYFHQRLDGSGRQQEEYPHLDPDSQPVRRVLDGHGRHLHVHVDLPGRRLHLAIWMVRVGRVRLFLLDANTPYNGEADRQITSNLYLGDQRRRIEQEIVLGIGGVRALVSAGICPTVFHMNEGHAAFMALERVRLFRDMTGLSFDQCREAAAAAHVFTTHTPVPAGIDRFPPSLIEEYFAASVGSYGLDLEGLLALGRENVADKNEAFSMAVLAIRCSRFCNGVSRLHGEVSRGMWREIWPGTPIDDIPIGHVTNGVHAQTWIDPDLRLCLDRAITPAWRNDPEDPSIWSGIDHLTDADLWRHRMRARTVLIDEARRRLSTQAAGGPRNHRDALDPNILTIGFARRFAGYKRASLIMRNPERLAALFADDRPIQIIIAGKSHPGDGLGKELIQQIASFASLADANGRIVFLEDYDIGLAQLLVRGCDVWLNNPIRGLEASGTSGMKAAMNGVINLSSLDGWWDEGFDEAVGFAITPHDTYLSDAPDDVRDSHESEDLYRQLEGPIRDLFYTRDQAGIPLGWVRMVRQSICRLTPTFSTQRMLRDYSERYYRPANLWGHKLSHNELKPGRDVADFIQKLRAGWSSLRIRRPHCEPIGSGLRISTLVDLGTLCPEDVSVEMVLDSPSNTLPRVTPLEPKGGVGEGGWVYAAELKNPHGGLHEAHARIIPNHPDLISCFIPGLIINSQSFLIEG